jgi:hypothetical protein
MIDGLEIPIWEAQDYSEDFERFGGFGLLRTCEGTGIRQANWVKHKVTLSGSGSLPPAFTLIDHTVTHTLKLAVGKAIQSASNVIVVPAARRSDVAVEGYAVMSVTGFLVPTAVSIPVNTATLTIVPGAVAYRVVYWPQFTVWIDPPKDDADHRSASHSWSITAEEA